MVIDESNMKVVSALCFNERPEELATKVLFVEGGRLENGQYANEPIGYFMSSKTYNSIPSKEEPSLKDFKEFGDVIKANNNDIHDPEI